MKFLNRFSVFFLPLLFFLISLLTIYDYGINWDSPIHFARGQAYLRYMLTGKTNYDNHPSYCTNTDNLSSRVDYQTGEVCDRHRKIRVSEYESNLIDFNSWVAKAVYGHPAFSDIMLAASNLVFFKHLGLLEDVNAYHFYSLFATFLLALTVSVWTKNTFGTFASIIAVLTIYTFPLLFAEQHFNVKDPPMAAFFSISLYFFWLSIVKKKALYLILSALAGGVSFGTKFNFAFAPLILLPWFLIYILTLLKKGFPHHQLLISKIPKILLRLFSKKMLLAFFLYPIIVFLVFFLSWPALWENPIHSVLEVFRFYKNIGGSSCHYFYFTIPWFTKCTQIVTLQYFLYTLPPFSFILFLIGSFVGIGRFKEKNYVTILWLIFFYFTILRVTFSLTSIYGGLRQILEFVPPMAMIAGVGALFLRDLLVKISTKLLPAMKFSKAVITTTMSLVIISGFIPILLQIKELHPNQNIYFNFLTGGLKGATQKNFPGYGNTYGNAYLQGIKWLNQNAQPQPRLALVSGNAQNIPRGILREDIDFSNGSRSGYNQEGEYQMLLIDSQDQFSQTFRYKYLDKFLDPVYDLKVDDISLLKIWKNDKNHLKEETNQSLFSKVNKINFTLERENTNIILKLGEKKSIQALGVTFSSEQCKQSMIGARVLLAEHTDQYLQKADSINGFASSETAGFEGDLVYLFTGDVAQYILLTPPLNYDCALSDTKFTVYVFDQIIP